MSKPGIDHRPIPATGDVTAALAAWNKGESRAMDRVISLVYHELRGVATQILKGESRCLSLAPTALVHELYPRLLNAGRLRFNNRAHFFFFAGRIMRRLLVERARYRLRCSRGGGLPRSLPEGGGPVLANGLDPEWMLSLDHALSELEHRDRRRCRIVEMRSFAGFDHGEIAGLLGLSERTVKREWRTARLWLARAVGAGHHRRWPR